MNCFSLNRPGNSIKGRDSPSREAGAQGHVPQAWAASQAPSTDEGRAAAEPCVAQLPERGPHACDSRARRPSPPLRQPAELPVTGRPRRGAQQERELRAVPAGMPRGGSNFEHGPAGRPGRVSAVLPSPLAHPPFSRWLELPPASPVVTGWRTAPLTPKSQGPALSARTELAPHWPGSSHVPTPDPATLGPGELVL